MHLEYYGSLTQVFVCSYFIDIAHAETPSLGWLSIGKEFKEPLNVVFIIEHDDLGVVLNSSSLQAELLIKLAGNPILEACPELIPGTLSFVLSTYFSTLCHPLVLGNFGHYVQDILAFPLVTEGQVPKITVNDMLKASSMTNIK